MAMVIIPTFDRRIKIHASLLDMGDYHLTAQRDEKDRLKEITYKPDRYGLELSCLWDYRVSDGVGPWLLDQRLTDRGLILASLHYLSPDGFFSPGRMEPLDAQRVKLLYWLEFHQEPLARFIGDKDFKFLMGDVENIKTRHFKNMIKRNKLLRATGYREF